MGIAEQLEKLQALRDRGALSEVEYQRAKAQVLGEGTPARPCAQGFFFQQLSRSRTDRYIGGVCGGLGHHTALPAWAWRVIFCLIAFYLGAGILFYLLLWLFLPLGAPESASA